MLLIAVTLSTCLMATDYLVSDAGSSEVNGTYTESGTYNGYAQYRLGSTDLYLRYNDMMGSRWEIWDDMMFSTYYYTEVSGSTPPASGWTTDMGDPLRQQ